jgi:hypothetical protein
MASIINASTSGVGGVITTADNTGDLNIQSGGSTKIAVTSAGAAVTGTLTVNGTAIAPSKILQVVQGTNGNSVGITTSTFVTLNLSASITPTSATSKIYIIVALDGVGRDTGNTSFAGRILRDATQLRQFGVYSTYTNTTQSTYASTVSCTYLDSPATTSAITYSVQGKSTNNVGNVYVNTDGASVHQSTITLMEVAA